MTNFAPLAAIAGLAGLGMADGHLPLHRCPARRAPIRCVRWLGSESRIRGDGLPAPGIHGADPLCFGSLWRLLAFGMDQPAVVALARHFVHRRRRSARSLAGFFGMRVGHGGQHADHRRGAHGARRPCAGAIAFAGGSVMGMRVVALGSARPDGADIHLSHSRRSALAVRKHFDSVLRW